VGEDTRQIERDIRIERNNLDRNLHELEAQAKALTDWRTHYRNHPAASLSVAFGGGLLMALLVGGRRNGHAAPRMASAATPRPRSAGFNALRALGDYPRARQQVSETWERILETLIGVASAKAVDLLGSVVPGFRGEYDSRHLGRDLR
jgi:hypothetical protein